MFQFTIRQVNGDQTGSSVHDALDIMRPLQKSLSPLSLVEVRGVVVAPP